LASFSSIEGSKMHVNYLHTSSVCPCLTVLLLVILCCICISWSDNAEHEADIVSLKMHKGFYWCRWNMWGSSGEKILHFCVMNIQMLC